MLRSTEPPDWVAVLIMASVSILLALKNLFFQVIKPSEKHLYTNEYKGRNSSKFRYLVDLIFMKPTPTFDKTNTKITLELFGANKDSVNRIEVPAGLLRTNRLYCCLIKDIRVRILLHTNERIPPLKHFRIFHDCTYQNACIRFVGFEVEDCHDDRNRFYFGANCDVNFYGSGDDEKKQVRIDPVTFTSESTLYPNFVPAYHDDYGKPLALEDKRSGGVRLLPRMTWDAFFFYALLHSLIGFIDVLALCFLSAEPQGFAISLVLIFSGLPALIVVMMVTFVYRNIIRRSLNGLRFPFLILVALATFAIFVSIPFVIEHRRTNKKEYFMSAKYANLTDKNAVSFAVECGILVFAFFGSLILYFLWAVVIALIKYAYRKKKMSRFREGCVEDEESSSENGKRTEFQEDSKRESPVDSYSTVNKQLLGSFVVRPTKSEGRIDPATLKVL